MITEEAAAALRKANKWAQSGLIVSVGPPMEALVQEAAGGITTGDKKKTAQTAVCRDRNADLARYMIYHSSCACVWFLLVIFSV